MPLVRRKLNFEQLTKARALRNKGLSYQQIVRILHLNLAHTSLARALANPNYGYKDYCGNTKLSPKDVHEIRFYFKNLSLGRYARGRWKAIKFIARNYGTTPECINEVIKFKTWRNVA